MSLVIVSYVKGDDLYSSVSKSLQLIEDEIKEKARVVIKPNLVSTRNPLSATEVEHIKAIVDFFEGKCDKIRVAESSAMGQAEDGFKNYGYYDQLKSVEFINLDKEQHEKVPIFDEKGNKKKINVSKLMMDKRNFMVSAAKLKTHDFVVATLSAKNVIMGSMIEKGRMHPETTGHPEFITVNRNLAEVMKKLHIDLAVIDGINAMEGNGPTQGSRINAGCVIASTDFLAADRVALEVMGINPDNIGYLNYIYELGFGEFDLNKIRIVGDQLEKGNFKLHDTVEEQYKWR